MVKKGAILWSFKKQPTVTLSATETTEAEYMSICRCHQRFLDFSNIFNTYTPVNLLIKIAYPFCDQKIKIL